MLLLKVARWWLTLVGGVLLGMGLVLHGQLAFFRYMHEQVESTFILWRGIGKLTFFFQDNLTKAALEIHEIPKELVDEADRAAWTLVVIGVALVVVAFLIRRSASAKQTSRGSAPPARA